MGDWEREYKINITVDNVTEAICKINRTLKEALKEFKGYGKEYGAKAVGVLFGAATINLTSVKLEDGDIILCNGKHMVGEILLVDGHYCASFSVNRHAGLGEGEEFMYQCAIIKFDTFWE